MEHCSETIHPSSRGIDRATQMAHGRYPGLLSPADRVETVTFARERQLQPILSCVLVLPPKSAICMGKMQ
jgi:hypothetical protein